MKKHFYVEQDFFTYSCFPLAVFIIFIICFKITSAEQMSCEILYGLISNSMQTAITYLGTVLESALQNSCQAALEASFSQIFPLKDQGLQV